MGRWSFVAAACDAQRRGAFEFAVLDIPQEQLLLPVVTVNGRLGLKVPAKTVDRWATIEVAVSLRHDEEVSSQARRGRATLQQTERAVLTGRCLSVRVQMRI